MTARAISGGRESLPVGKTILLEASAGTGKTWQIEGLVVRLVAEHEVPIDRALVITFTNAAAAELRDRIRARLVRARDALGRPEAPTNDPVVEQLWQRADERPAMQSRLAAALSDFDLAPISTIHGFSQRMLTELAFESAEEPGLELVTDPTPLLVQLVDDVLAAALARATDEELPLLGDMGFGRAELVRLARAMTSAVEPQVEPCPRGGDPSSADPLEVARRWLAARRALRSWLDSTEATSCVSAVLAELARKKGKRLDGRRMRRDWVADRFEALRQWLDGPACRSTREGSSPSAAAVRSFSLEGLAHAWIGDPAALEAFEGYPLFARLSALLAEQDRLWPLPLVGFARSVRGRFARELARGSALTYDRMISRLAERIAEQATTDPDGGPLARAIRARFDVALVDEFQDTDGAQWPVLRAVFSHPTRRLIIIGDPKQAIYAFRGADVHVYLDAARMADTRATMRTNFRSDGAYVAALNHLWFEGSGAFELDDVDYVAVASASSAWAARFRRSTERGREEPPRCPLELRWVDGQTIGATERPIGSKEVAEDLAARLAADEAARLLDGSSEVLDEREGAWRPLEPGDIAVLVRTNHQAELVRASLAALRIPAVSAGRGSVMRSPVVGWLCAWLDAVAAPRQDRLARALATTPLFGWSARDLALGSSAADGLADVAPSREGLDAVARWAAWLESIARWAHGWPTRGFVGVLERALDEHDVVRRLLGATGGDRHATDLRHLIELCHAEERRTRLGPFGLASWLRAARARAGDGSDEAEALRLESDARAVQLVTLHKSKGLEYPVVLLPFAWADFQSEDRGGPILWHARVGDRTELRLSLELPGTGQRDEAARVAALESRQEQTRLLYVGLTRARHHAVGWLGPLGSAATDAESYALGRIALRARDGKGRPAPKGVLPKFPKPTTAKKADTLAAHAAECEAAWRLVGERLDRLAKTSAGTVGWSTASLAKLQTPQQSGGPVPEPLEARPWPVLRTLSGPWQISSYSAMVAGRTFDPAEPQRLDEIRAGAAFEPADPEDVGEGEEVGAQVELREPRVTLAGGPRDAPIATAELFGGTDVGTWVHAVLEELDFESTVARDGRNLDELVAALGARHGVRSPEQHRILAAALPSVLETPLDGGTTGLPADFALRSLGSADRLDEVGFDLRLGAGSHFRRTAEASGGRLNHEGARVALEHRLGDEAWGGEGWLRAVLDRAAQDELGVLPRIAGILTGFVDLVFRVADRAPRTPAAARYFVADYKTNRIAPAATRRQSLACHYTQPWLAWEMARHGYHLQALLYTVALHRLLRQRLADYSYETHVGGHLYLFVRGMGGAATARDAGLALGVYADRWPAAVVLGLDAALSGASTDEVQAIVNRAAMRGGAR